MTHMWKTAVHQEISAGGTVMRSELYRLIVPIAVRSSSGVVIVEPVWSQCRSPRSSPVTHRYCVVYYPPDIDAIVYLYEYYNFWREVKVRCDSGDVEFCRALERCASELWKPRQRPLSPDEVVAELPKCFNVSR